MYDEQFDVLEVFFQKPGAAPKTRVVELAEDVYARVAPSTRRVIGLTIHRFRARGARFGFPLERRRGVEHGPERAVEPPDEDQVEPAGGGVVEQPPLRTAAQIRGRGPVHKLASEHPSLSLDELPQGDKLCLQLLLSVVLTRA